MEPRFPRSLALQLPSELASRRQSHPLDERGPHRPLPLGEVHRQGVERHPGTGLFGPEDHGDACVGLDAQRQVVRGQARGADAREQPSPIRPCCAIGR
jgi:hypothetical protein